MEKSPEAFRTIREVADWLGVAAHVLRFWESQFPQIRPVKRAGGRRYYRPADMKVVGGIKVMLHDQGMSIRSVQQIIREDGLAAVSAYSPPIVSEADAETRDDAALVIYDAVPKADGQAATDAHASGGITGDSDSMEPEAPEAEAPALESAAAAPALQQPGLPFDLFAAPTPADVPAAAAPPLSMGEALERLRGLAGNTRPPLRTRAALEALHRRMHEAA